MPDSSRTNNRIAFIVKDAKTYINAEEAWYQFSGKKEGSVLFIVIPVKDPNNTIPTFNEVIDQNKWEHIVWFYSLSNYAPRDLKRLVKRWKLLTWLYNGKEYIFNFIDRVRLDQLAKKYKPIDTVFSGHRNTQEHLAAALNPKDLYLMDSGMGVTNKINRNGYIDYRSYLRRHRFKYLMHKISGLKVYDRDKTHFFTIYKDAVKTKHKITENSYSYRKMLVKKKELGDLTFYISSPLYKRQNISVQEYIHFVQNLFDYFKLDYSKVIYVPHPVHEKKKNVKEIVEALGCQVDSRDIPIETKITMYDSLPKMCISPYSSSLVNISVFSEKRFPLIFAWHYEFNCFKTLYNWRKESLEKNSNVDIVPVNDTISLFGFDKDECEQPIFKDFEDWDAAINSNKFVKEIDPSLKKSPHSLPL